MNFSTYYPLALRTCKTLPTNWHDLEHCAIGMLTELGEFATEAKRITIYGREMTAEMRDHMVEELGDFQWYIPVGLRALGFQELPQLALALLELRALSALSPASLCLRLAQHVGFMCELVESSSKKDHQLTHLNTSFELWQAGQSLATCVLISDYVATALLGCDGGHVRKHNIEKLWLRYPDVYADEAAEARADKGGLDARSS